MEREKKRFNTHEAPHDIYEKAKAGWPVPGINAPYETPLNPELILDTVRMSAKEAFQAVRDFLKTKEFF